MIRKKGIGYWTFTSVNTLLMVSIIIACLVPMLHVLFASFSDPTWVMNNTGLIMWPHNVNVNGYRLVFQTVSIQEI